MNLIHDDVDDDDGGDDDDGDDRDDDDDDIDDGDADDDDARAAADAVEFFFWPNGLFSKGGAGSRPLRHWGINWLCCALRLSLGPQLHSYRTSSTS